MRNDGKVTGRNGIDGATLGGAAIGTAAALGALAVYNRMQTARAEQQHPPRGALIEVGGQLVHVVQLGPADAPAVVLLHGNVVALDDWLVSGVAERLAPTRRVVMIDRPGYGYSERPAGRWGVVEQAALMRDTCRVLGIRRPVVVGQSLGTMVALAWALDPAAVLSGLVLVSGYYYPTARMDAVLVAPAAMPVVGPLLRNTVSPPFTRAMLGATLKGMFAPREVPERMLAEFPLPLISRPEQLRAISEDGSAIAAEAARLVERRTPIRGPVAIITGDADAVIGFEAQSVRLAHEIGARLTVLPGVGHMAHHAAPELVADAATAFGA